MFGGKDHSRKSSDRRAVHRRVLVSMCRKDPKEKWPKMTGSSQTPAEITPGVLVPVLGLGRVSNHQVLSWGTPGLSSWGLHTRTPHLSGQVSSGMRLPTPSQEKTTNHLCTESCSNYEGTPWFIPPCSRSFAKHVFQHFSPEWCSALCRGGLMEGCFLGWWTAPGLLLQNLVL